MTPEEFFESLDNKFLFVSSDEDRKFIAYNYGLTRKQKEENPYDSLEVDKIILIEDIDKDEYRANIREKLASLYENLELKINNELSKLPNKFPVVDFLLRKIDVVQKYITDTHMERDDFETIPYKLVAINLRELREKIDNEAYSEVESEREIWEDIFKIPLRYLQFKKYWKTAEPKSRAGISYVYQLMKANDMIYRDTEVSKFLQWLRDNEFITQGLYDSISNLDPPEKARRDGARRKPTFDEIFNL